MTTIASCRAMAVQLLVGLTIICLFSIIYDQNSGYLISTDCRAAARFSETLFGNGPNYTEDPRVLLEYRAKIAAALEKLGSEM